MSMYMIIYAWLNRYVDALPKTSSGDSGSVASVAAAPALGSGDKAFNKKTKTDSRGEALRCHGNRAQAEQG